MAFSLEEAKPLIKNLGAPGVVGGTVGFGAFKVPPDILMSAWNYQLANWIGAVSCVVATLAAAVIVKRVPDLLYLCFGAAIGLAILCCALCVWLNNSLGEWPIGLDLAKIVRGVWIVAYAALLASLGVLAWTSWLMSKALTEDRSEPSGG